MASPLASEMDLSDVAQVASADLWMLIQIMIEGENGLLFLRGVNETDRARIEQRFWLEFEGTTERGVAALVRFWSLVDVFQSRRLRLLLLTRGYEIFYPAAAAASQLRLNLHWGFNPQRFIWAMSALHRTSSNANKSLSENEISEVRLAA